MLAGKYRASRTSSIEDGNNSGEISMSKGETRQLLIERRSSSDLDLAISIFP